MAVSGVFTNETKNTDTARTIIEPIEWHKKVALSTEWRFLSDNV